MALSKDKSKVVATVIENTTTSIIKITEDKLVLILTQHIEKLRKNHDCLSLAALSATLLITLLTSDFKVVLGVISPEFIKGVFVSAFFISLYFTIKAGIRANKDRNSVERIMKEIKSLKD